VTQIDLGAFLSGELHPEQETLLRRIANFILDPRRADASDDEWSAAGTGGDWSNVELRELRDMLLRGLSIEEIKRLLRRDH